jgi:cell division protein FtsN
MPIDYHERKQVNKNRPKNRPVKLVFLLVAGVVLVIYSLGVATGWFLNKAMKTSPSGAMPTVSADAKPKTNDTPLPAGIQPQPQSNNGKSNDPPLTFYYTLPKGEKSALGSGLNPTKRNAPPIIGSKSVEQAKVKQVLTQGEPPRSNPAAGTRPDSSGPASTETESGKSAVRKNLTDIEPDDKALAQKKTEAANKRYTVQVASCSTRKEAEAMKNALDKQGLLSYVVESKIPGKGTWYRVRLGNQLDLETANKIAAKAGKGSIVVPE